MAESDRSLRQEAEPAGREAFVAWLRAYTPPWLPPAGYVRLAEDVDEFTAALARSQQTASGSVVEARSNEQGPPHESI